MHGVSHAQDDKRTLSRQRQTRLGGVETGTRGLLNLTDAHALLADDGADEDVRNEEAKGIGLGLRGGRLIEWLLVERADDEAECLDACQH